MALSGLWQRIKDRVAGWFHREPVPGRFETGSKFSIHGRVGSAPFVWPSREYLVYIPKGRSRFRRAPLLVLCHGCKQSPEEIAQGTRVTELADRMGWVVLFPRQKESANPWRCWNWFDAHTWQGRGEAAIVAAQIRSVRRAYRIHRKRVLVAGMSAGGALAATLGVRYPLLVSAVMVHSGLPCGAATSAHSAISVMKNGPDQDVESVAEETLARERPRELRMPLLAIHGDQDDVVAPRNATALVRQYLRLNHHPAVENDVDGAGSGMPPPDFEEHVTLEGGRTEVVRDWRRDGKLVVRHIAVAGLGHAWGGGDASLPYNDSGLPNATALLGAFFTDVLA